MVRWRKELAEWIFYWHCKLWRQWDVYRWRGGIPLRRRGVLKCWGIHWRHRDVLGWRWGIPLRHWVVLGWRCSILWRRRAVFRMTWGYNLETSGQFGGWHQSKVRSCYFAIFKRLLFFNVFLYVRKKMEHI